RASAYREYFVYDDRRDDVPANPEFFVFDATFRLESELWRLGAEYTGSYEHRTGPGAAPFALTYGAQWEREALTDETSGDFGDNTQSLDRPSGSVFAEARATLPGRVYLLAGARAERYEGLPTEVTPRVSAVYEAVPGALSLRAAAGMAYKAPNLQEQYLDNPFIAGNPDLEPERSTSWEVGADVRALDDRATLGLTWFHQRFEDLIRTVQLEGDTRQINRNLGSSLAQGVEWTARWEGSDRWAVGTEGAWIATEVRDNRGLSPDQFPEGEALPGRPEVVGSAYLEVAAGPRLRAILRGTHVGSQVQLSERFSGQRVELDAYTLAGVTVHYLVSPRWSVYGRLQNLFDTEYEAAFDRPGAPLSAALGVRLN
ncbi:MAG TPA: TonB-dependent receptor, partial [Longimicrobiaceae bacterium]|nr:TonB-dependent receptor [Longimicrobiaceae bacterium]